MSGPVDPRWYFDPTKWPVKMLRFLHLVEDDVVRFSLTGIQMWVTTINNVVHLQMVHDVASGASAALSAGINIAAAAFHHAKRGQMLNAKDGP